MMAMQWWKKFAGVCAGIIGIAVFSIHAFAVTESDLKGAISNVSGKVTGAQTQTQNLSQSVPKLVQKLNLTNINQASLFVVGISTNNVAGGTIQVPLNFLAGPVPVSGLQEDIVVAASFTIVGVTAGPAATQAGKSVQSNIMGNMVRMIAFGLNANPILSGNLATLTIKSASVAPNGPSQIVAVNPVATDASGNAVLLTNTAGLVVLK